MKITVTRNDISLEEVDFSELIFEGEEASFSIGRSKDCHIFLDDQKISREQARLIYDGTKWYVESTSDYTNIFINNQTVRSRTELTSGDYLSVGEYVLGLEFEMNISPPVVEQEGPPTEIIEEVPAIEEEGPEEASQEDVTESFVPEPDTELPTEEMSLEDDIDSQLEEETMSMSENPEETEGENDFGGDEGFDQGDFQDEYSEDFGDGYDVQEYEDDESTRVFSGFAKFSLELFGEFAPYDSYNIVDTEVYIGRDPNKCQIVLNDPEVSSVHAIIKKTNISCSIEDLQSANGTIVNGKRINKKEIVGGDEIVIGSTTLTARVGSEFLDSQSKNLMPVDENQVMEVEEIVEVDEDEEFFDDEIGETEEEAPKSLVGKFKKAWKNPEQRKKIIIGGSVLALLWMLLDDGSSSKKKSAVKAKDAVAKKKDPKAEEKVLTPEQVELAESLYQLGRAYAEEEKYPEAMVQFEKLFKIKKDYKNAQQMYELVKQGFKEQEMIEEEKRKAIEEKKRKLKVAELLEKAKKAVEERNVVVAESLFAEIKTLDPENYDVTSLKLDLDAWKKAKEEKEMAEIQKKQERKRQEDALAPGRNLYLKEAWYDAIGALEKFLKLKGIDEDLVKEGTKMLKDSKRNHKAVLDPLLARARSFKEGEDLKGAYAAYSEVLKFDPSSNEALNELDDIRSSLTRRAQKIYRDGIVSESLGLFDEARERFQEVQQVAPEDNEYYIKASDKLRDL